MEVTREHSAIKRLNACLRRHPRRDDWVDGIENLLFRITTERRDDRRGRHGLDGLQLHGA